jgi:hypothetical protein
VGERALVICYDRAERYDCYRSQWAELDCLIDIAVSGQCPVKEANTPSAGGEWKRSGRARWAELVDDLDYLSLDICVRCDPDAVSVYLPVWLGIPAGQIDRTESTCGVLLRVESGAEFARRRERIRRHKEILGSAIEGGLIGQKAARQSLLAVIGSHERYLSTSAVECYFGVSE